MTEKSETSTSPLGSPLRRRSGSERFPSQPQVYTQYKEDVANGKFEATEEDVKKLKLIPHFDPPNIDLSGDPRGNTFTIKKMVSKPKHLSNEDFFSLQSKAKSRAALIYERRMKPYYDKMKLDTKKLSQQNFSSLSAAQRVMSFSEAQRDQLQENLDVLKKNLQSIQQQNAALTAHLLLLNKAKQQLELSKNCLIQSTEWYRKEIDNFKKRQHNEESVEYEYEEEYEYE